MTRVYAPATRALAAAFVLTLAGGVVAAEDPAAPMLGQPAPSFRLQDLLSDRELSLEDFRRRFIVLHFGASW